MVWSITVSLSSESRSTSSVSTLLYKCGTLRIRHQDYILYSFFAGFNRRARVINAVVRLDILGVSDEDAWTYGEGLRQLSIDKEFNHIKFVRLWDILEHTDAAGRPKEYYLIHASCLRRELLARYAVPGFNAHAYLRSDEDACLTYRGYIKFLYKDLLHTNVNRRQDDGGALSGKKYKEAVENIARVMISRGKVCHGGPRSASEFVAMS